MAKMFIADNLFKIKYDILDKRMSKYKHSRDKILLVINIGYVLDTFFNITTNSSFIINNDMKIKFMIGILNIISHYRHYYYDKLNCSNSIIVYCDNNEQYETHKDILKDLRTVLEYIPNTLFIDKIGKDNNENFYSHFMYHLVDYYTKIQKVHKRRTIVNIISSKFIDYQVMGITETMILKPRKFDNQIYDCVDFWDDCLGKINTERLRDESISIELKELLIPHCAIFNKKDTSLDSKITLPRLNKKTISDNLYDFIKENRNSLSLIKDYGNLYLDEANYQKYENYLNSILAKKHPEIKEFIKPFFTMWKTKLKDNKILNINDFNKDFRDNNLKINWLLESGGL